MKDLGSLGGPKANSWASASMPPDWWWATRKPTAASTHAFLYTSGAGMKDLGTLGGDRQSGFPRQRRRTGGGLSAIGNAVAPRLSLRDDTGMKDLGTLGGPNSSALDINNSGQVVGGADAIAHGAAYATPSSTAAGG